MQKKEKRFSDFQEGLRWQKSTWTLQGTLERAFLLYEKHPRVKFMPDGSKKGLKHEQGMY
jgi:hypothetical protein